VNQEAELQNAGKMSSQEEIASRKIFKARRQTPSQNEEAKEQELEEKPKNGYLKLDGGLFGDDQKKVAPISF